jgi:ribonuclease VapC
LILDTSAVIALFRKEPGHHRLYLTLEQADAIAIAGPTLFETGMVALGRFDDKGLTLVEQFLEDWEVQVLEFGDRHWRMAVEAFARYGKGHHPAGLNYGDCMTYATARVMGERLLFVGNDFVRTDLAPA